MRILFEAYKAPRLSVDERGRYIRIRHLQKLINAKSLDVFMRWTRQPVEMVAA